MQWLFYERLRILLDQLFLDYNDSWLNEVSEAEKLLVCESLEVLLNFIFEPNQKKEVGKVLVPDIKIDLCFSIRAIWEYIQSVGSSMFLSHLTTWEDRKRYERVHKDIKRELARLYNLDAKESKYSRTLVTVHPLELIQLLYNLDYLSADLDDEFSFTDN